jgi:hypothetical protein
MPSITTTELSKSFESRRGQNNRLTPRYPDGQESDSPGSHVLRATSEESGSGPSAACFSQGETTNLGFPARGVNGCSESWLSFCRSQRVKFRPHARPVILSLEEARLQAANKTFSVVAELARVPTNHPEVWRLPLRSTRGTATAPRPPNPPPLWCRSPFCRRPGSSFSCR